jgi:hypothetical protein
MSSHALVAHHTRGRIRVKVPAAKGNPELLREIEQLLAPAQGVQSVEVNPTTGSVVVHYDHTAHEDFHQTLTGHGESSGLFALQPPELTEVDHMAEAIQREAEFLAAHSETAKTIVDFTKNLNDRLRRATDNNLDLKVLLPLGLAVYAFLEVGAEVSTPLWVTLGIFSFNSFVQLHPPLPEVSVQSQQVVRKHDKTVATRTTRRPKT